MFVFGIIATCILGFIVGSFLNVLVLRYGTGKGLSGRSQCLSCSAQLRWYELIPVVSYLVQKGRCRNCSSRIRRQYVIVESVTGLLFAVNFVVFWPLLFADPAYLVTLLVGFAIVSLFIFMSVYDYHHTVLPNVAVWTFVVIAFCMVWSPLLGGQDAQFLAWPGWKNLLAGPIISLPFYAMWRYSDGRWIGLGDVKFMLGMGWMLGLWKGLSALALSFWIGTAIIGLIAVTLFLIRRLRLAKHPKRFIMPIEIPFAPFLVMGTLVVYFFDATIFELLSYVIR